MLLIYPILSEGDQVGWAGLSSISCSHRNFFNNFVVAWAVNYVNKFSTQFAYCLLAAIAVLCLAFDLMCALLSRETILKWVTRMSLASRLLSLSLSCTQSLSDKVVGLSGALQVLRFGAKHTNSKVRLALCQLPHPLRVHTHTLWYSHHSSELRVAVYVAIECLSTLYSKLISVVPPLLLLLLLVLYWCRLWLLITSWRVPRAACRKLLARLVYLFENDFARKTAGTWN